MEEKNWRDDGPRGGVDWNPRTPIGELYAEFFACGYEIGMHQFQVRGEVFAVAIARGDTWPALVEGLMTEIARERTAQAACGVMFDLGRGIQPDPVSLDRVVVR